MIVVVQVCGVGQVLVRGRGRELWYSGIMLKDRNGMGGQKWPGLKIIALIVAKVELGDCIVNALINGSDRLNK